MKNKPLEPHFKKVVDPTADYRPVDPVHNLVKHRHFQISLLRARMPGKIRFQFASISMMKPVMSIDPLMKRNQRGKHTQLTNPPGKCPVPEKCSMSGIMRKLKEC